LSIIFTGLGYKDKLSDPDEEFDYPPDKKMIVKLQMPEHGYYTTAKGIILAGLTILKETDKLPGTGGVYTNNAAFLKTSMLKRCQKHLFQFSVLKTVEKK